MCWRFGIDYPPKLRWSNVIAQSTMRGHVYCIREKAIRLFNIDFTCTHGSGNNCERHVKSILLLSLNTHNHVDDYSGTSGSVHKVHISALVTSPKNWVVALSFSLCLSKTKQTKKWTSWLFSGRHVTQKWDSDQDCNKWRQFFRCNSILFKLLLETPTDPWTVMIASLDD